MYSKKKQIEKPQGCTWKVIPNCGARYEVNELGQVWSNDKKIVKRPVNLKNYVVIHIKFDSGLCARPLGLLVAEAFIQKPNDGKRYYVCRYDNDHRNNRADNLYWGSGREVSDSRRRRGTVDPGKPGGLSKLIDSDVIEMRALYAEGGISMAALGKKYGISGASVSHIIARRTWAHL